jgi:serine/threonine-protein kinase HipA
MGALEYAPATQLRSLNASQPVDIQSLVSIAQEILDARGRFNIQLSQHGREDRAAMMSLLSVGMSAGGSRPKAVLAFGDPLGYGAMEFVYHLMAKRCGVDMMPCRLLHEGNRRHFITQRFDRINNKKIHVQTLNGIAHVDYKKTGIVLVC